MINTSQAGSKPEAHTIVDQWLAGGEIVPAQLPSPSTWSPEKKLAAAVLTEALVSVRQNPCSRAKRRLVAEDLAWISSNDTSWPFAFVPLCELFGLDPTWVREAVCRWQKQPRGQRVRHVPRFRHAA